MSNEVRIEDTERFEKVVRDALLQDDLEMFQLLFQTPPFQVIHLKERNITIEIVQKSLPRNVNMIVDSSTQNSLLMMAILRHSNKIVEYLLKEYKYSSQVCGSQALLVNYKNSIQSNCFHIAASCGNVEAAILILQCSKFTGKNDRDLYGNHAMHLAATKGHHDMLRILRSVFNLEINSKKSSSGKTPLFVAIENNDFLATKMLLQELGAMYNARDNQNRTAVMYLASSSSSSSSSPTTTATTGVKIQTKLITLMLSHDMDSLCKSKDKSKQNVLHKCTISKNLKFLRIFALMVPQQLYSSIINEVDSLQNTPLHYAVQSMNSKVVECLLLMGANTTIQDEDGNTPLHLAASLLEKNSHSKQLIYICKLLYERETLTILNRNIESVDVILKRAHFFDHYFDGKCANNFERSNSKSIPSSKRNSSSQFKQDFYPHST